MTKKIQLRSHDKEWQIVDGQEVLVPVEAIDIDPITDSSAVQIEGHRTLEETLAIKHQMTPEIEETKIMSKVGGAYHQNVVDGAYEEAILYGNSKVNVMGDDTAIAQPIPLTFTSFNNGLQKNLALGTNTVAPMLKGATLINRALTNSVSLASGEKFYIHNLKGNTIHTISFKFTTKNTNAGIVIESCTGETSLENSMYKTGLDDNVIFTVTTHANADSIAIVNNPAYGGETIKLDDIMVIEGDQTLMNLTFFKGMRSVELVKPLTNLFRNDLEYYNANVTSTNNNGTVTVTATSNNSWANVQYTLTNLKAHTNYLVMWDSFSTTQTSLSSADILICMVQISNNSNLGRMDNNSLNPTRRCIMFNTGNIPLTDIALRIHATLGNTETATTIVKGLRVFEWDDATSRALDLQGIGYFSGTKNVSIPNFKTNSKNLYPFGDINFTNDYVGWCDAKGTKNMYGDIALKSQCRFLLKKGRYILSSNYSARTNIDYITFVTDKEESLGNNFTLEQDTYITLRLKTLQANVPTTLTNIQIERGSTKTDYVPYDTRQYKPDNQDVVILRSLPNGVCDTFNLQTGEYTRRIGEIVLNGSENWTLNKSLGNGSFNQFVVNRVQAKKIIRQEVVCDKLISCYHETVNNVIWIYDGAVIVIQSSHTNADELKAWLQQNPLTVQYEFAQPSTIQIPTVNNIYNASSKVDFKEGKNASFRCFGNPTYLEVGSLSPVNPIVEPIINIPLNARLKANTSYTVRLDKVGSSLNIDLGGTTVSTSESEVIIKTPLVLSHNQIRFSGNGTVARVMVFEGDIRGIELPYFMGINNVKMPIVRNCGENLVDFDRDKSNWWFQGGINEVVKGDETGIPYSVLIPIAPLHYYTMSRSNGNRNFSVFLDEKYSTISWETNTNTTVLAPSNAKYLLWYLNSTGLSKDDNIMITASKERNNISTSYEPYRGNDVCLASGGIDLSQDMIEQGGFTTSNGSTYEAMKYASTTRLRSKSLIRVKPNTTYYIKNNLPRVVFNLYQWNENIEFMQGTSKTNNYYELTFTTTSDTHYIHFLFSKYGNENITASEFDWNLFQLIELDSTVQLRSLPNGVKDELNLLTGEYIQRVDEIVLDGSQDVNSWWNTTSTIGVAISIPTMKNISNLNCDKLPVVSYKDINNSTYDKDGIASWDNGNIVRFRIEKSKLSTEDVNGVKQYLQSNPVTVQYELAEPIISYPRIVSNTQEREVGIKLPNGVCDTYNPSTGVTVKRVGKVILDGSEKYVRDGSSTKPTDLERFSTPIGDMVSSPYNTGNFVVETSGYNIVNNDKTSPRKLPNVWNYYQANIYLDFATTAFGMTTSDSADAKISKLKTYLATNPITIYYELKNPVVTTDIVLPNGVHDDYNPITGLYTKRVGFIEFDGGETNLGYRIHSKGYLLADMNNIKLSGLETEPTDNILSNILVNSVSNIYQNTDITTNCIALHHQSTSLMIKVMNISTVDEYKTYLSQNPIKVWYELSTPQKIQLTPYFGLPMPYAYQGGHLIMDSAYDGVSLPPEFKYKLVANRTGQVNQNNIKLQQHTARLSNLEAILIEATLDSIFNREMTNFELELMDIPLIDLGE